MNENAVSPGTKDSDYVEIGPPPVVSFAEALTSDVGTILEESLAWRNLVGRVEAIENRLRATDTSTLPR